MSIYNDSNDNGGGGGGSFEDVSDKIIDTSSTGTTTIKAFKSGSIFIAFCTYKMNEGASHTAKTWLDLFKLSDDAGFEFCNLSSLSVPVFNNAFSSVIDERYIVLTNVERFNKPPDYDKKNVRYRTSYNSESFACTFIAEVKDV